MKSTEILALELGPSGSLMQGAGDDVLFVPPGEDADPGAVPATARIEANSLWVNAIAQANTQAEMPDWMAGSIEALHANIGRERGFGSGEYKTSPGFHDRPGSSSQVALESLIGKQNTVDPGLFPAGALTLSAHGYESDDCEGRDLHLGDEDDDTFWFDYIYGTVDLRAGGNNTVDILGGCSKVIAGAGDDKIWIKNDWDNRGHADNWSESKIDLSAGGNNQVDIVGDYRASGPTRAEITLGNGHDTINAHFSTEVTILGANSTGNHNILLRGVDILGVGTYDWQGEVHTGLGHTNVTLQFGTYDFYLGTGSVAIAVAPTAYGHVGVATIYDADGNLIVGRVDGQSPVADAVHSFSAGEGINLHYSLVLIGGVDKVQFYAGSGHYQVNSSANADIFQLDFGTGGTEGARYEVFDFKWGADQIIARNGKVFDELLLQDDHGVRLQYMGEENGQHAFDVVAVTDFGAYDAGHVWMTVYSNDLPDLNFL